MYKKILLTSNTQLHILKYTLDNKLKTKQKKITAKLRNRLHSFRIPSPRNIYSSARSYTNKYIIFSYMLVPSFILYYYIHIPTIYI